MDCYDMIVNIKSKNKRVKLNLILILIILHIPESGSHSFSVLLALSTINTVIAGWAASVLTADGVAQWTTHRLRLPILSSDITARGFCWTRLSNSTGNRVHIAFWIL